MSILIFMILCQVLGSQIISLQLKNPGINWFLKPDLIQKSCSSSGMLHSGTERRTMVSHFQLKQLFNTIAIYVLLRQSEFQYDRYLYREHLLL